MARSVDEAFDLFFTWLTPTETHRQAATRHRVSVEGAIKDAMAVHGFRQTGSFWHGTGVRYHSDVDLLVSIGGSRPASSDTALRWVKDALVARFPGTAIYVSRPAVVVDFAGGDERWEVIPAFYTGRKGTNVTLYDIPGAGSGWMDTAPVEHLNFVNESNDREVVRGGAKKLARLAKAWKYYNDVPVSSFYLEMRAAEHVATQSSFIPAWDISQLLTKLENHQLAGMNDPKDVAGRFYACSSQAREKEALSKLATAASRARKALAAYRDDLPDEAFRNLGLLFNGNFPAR